MRRQTDFEMRWKQLRAYGRENAAKWGFTEEGVDRLIHEHRRGG
jgi:hypothetical protein